MQLGTNRVHARLPKIHGLYRALARLARRAGPTYAGLVGAARQAPVNVPDATGWKVEGHLQWMHVTVSEQVTVYAILPGRGYEQSVLILGAAYAGFLVHDGWAPYYRFLHAFHQSCLRHLLTRCQELARIASPAAAAFPSAVQDLLQTSLQFAGPLSGRRDLRARFPPRHGASGSAPGPVVRKNRIEIRRIAGWRNTSHTNGCICSPFSTVRVWTQRTTRRSRPCAGW